MLISCRRFTDLVASGELQEAGWLTRLQAGQHRWGCTRCRAFEHNDRALDDILSAHRDRLTRPDDSPDQDGSAGPPG
jgi:hypothetical protein